MTTFVTAGVILEKPKSVSVGIYEGNWKMEVGPHGWGESFHALNVLEYTGYWCDGQRHGQGKAFDAGGRLVYDGEWAFGLRQGKGKEHALGRLLYEGEFAFDQRHGLGRLYGDNGDSIHEGLFFEGRPYVGKTLKGCPHGVGTLYHEDGIAVCYEGDWELGRRHGQGTSYYPDGQVEYSGGWRSDRLHGYGIIRHDNGQIKYSGQFFEGKQRGSGTLCDRDGNLVSAGEWYEGVCVSDALAEPAHPVRSQKNGEINAILDEFCGQLVGFFGCEGPDLMNLACETLIKKHPHLGEQARFFALLRLDLDKGDDFSEDQGTINTLVDHIETVNKALGLG